MGRKGRHFTFINIGHEDLLGTKFTPLPARPPGSFPCGRAIFPGMCCSAARLAGLAATGLTDKAPDTVARASIDAGSRGIEQIPQPPHTLECDAESVDVETFSISFHSRYRFAQPNRGLTHVRILQ